MSSKKFLAAILVLALVSMACSITIDLPNRQLKPSTPTTENVNVPLPGDSNTIIDLTINFAAGTLDVTPGASNALLSGTATTNVTDLKPKISSTGNNVTISQWEGNFSDFPRTMGDVRNEWDLKLGAQPLSLAITAGAYQGRYELGGLSLYDLHVTEGASDSQLSFAAPNPVEMDTLRYETAASKTVLSGLGNANFSHLVFRGGAGDFTLDFSGQLRRAADADIQSGLSSLTIAVPSGTAVRLSITGGLTDVKTEGAWQSSGGNYVLSGNGPELTITVKMGAGTVILTNP